MKTDIEIVIIKNAFADMYTVARFNAKKNFKNEKYSGKRNLVRVLVPLKNVAQNPDKYFAPENTFDAWERRAREYAANHPEDVKKYGEQYVYNVAFGCVVKQPREMVFDEIKIALSCDGLFDFCGAVQDYYYEQGNALLNHTIIQDFADKMSKRAKIVKQKNPIKRAVMHWWAGNKRQY